LKNIADYVSQMELDKIANKLQSLILQVSIDVDGEPLRIEISLGTTLTTETDTIDSLLNRAAARLHESKSSD
jgi:hypothetical protein